MKTFRVTYRPYTQITTIEEHFRGASKEWSGIGGDNAHDLQELLRSHKCIQVIGLPIIEYIDKQCDCEFIIEFRGLTQDFNDLYRIFDYYRSKDPNCRLQDIVHTVVFDKPLEIINQIDDCLDQIESLYRTDFPQIGQRLSEEIAKCRNAKGDDLTILVVGEQNCGKSTLINAIIGKGEDILPVSGDVETATLFSIKGSDYNYIRIIEGDKSTQINFDNFKPICNEIDSPMWICELVDHIRLDGCTTIYSCMRQILQAINDTCKIQQNDSSQYFDSKEVEVGLKDCLHDKNGRAFCIRDLPGSGAAYLSYEHKKIIADNIYAIDNAITLYVISKDNLNHSSPLHFLEEIIDDVKNSSDTQIDFDRSIYVVNKVEENPREVHRILKRYDAYKDKKWVLTSSKHALEIQKAYYGTNPKPVRSATKEYFIDEDTEYAIDLSLHHILPKSYTKTVCEALIHDALPGANAPEAHYLLRTGIPLVQGLINDYNTNIFSVYKVKCLYDAVNKTIEVLNTEQINLKNELQNKEEDLQQERHRIKVAILADMEEKYSNYINNEHQQDVKQNLKNILLNFLSDIQHQMESRIVVAKDLEKGQKSDFKQAKLNAKKAKISIDLPQVTPWKHHLELALYHHLEIDVLNSLRQCASELQATYITGFKKTLIDALSIVKENEDYALEEKIGEIIQKINDYEPIIQSNDFSIAKYKYLGELLTIRTSTHAKKINHQFEEFWSDKIVEPNINTLWKHLHTNLDGIMNDIRNDLEQLSPALISKQQEINVTQDNINLIADKIQTTREIRDRCHTWYTEAHT